MLRRRRVQESEAWGQVLVPGQWDRWGRLAGQVRSVGQVMAVLLRGSVGELLEPGLEVRVALELVAD